eukprot:TRINITY_DN1000_c0_g1_i1.p2 TRINITY_DN1000_c0_g1~~TRINITY_DN1000_c0_g1_i1.p2  ORF type:complete len:736 (-),score=163.19 TRINITY_DN1000_c0_g1_i1:2799-4982(-)
MERASDAGPALGPCDEAELLYLVALHLRQSPLLRDAAAALERALAEHRLLPQRRSWTNALVTTPTVDELQRLHPHVTGDFLARLLGKLVATDAQARQFSTCRGVTSLLAEGYCSLLPQRLRQPHSAPPRGDKDIAHLALGRQLHGRNEESRGTRTLVSKMQASRFAKLAMVIGHRLPVYCVKFDSAGQRFITGSDDGLVKLWSVETGMLLRTLRGHTDHIIDLVVSPDDSLLATASADKTVRVWDLRTYAPVSLLHHDNVISTLAWNPNPAAHALITADVKGCSKVWATADWSAPPIVVPTDRRRKIIPEQLHFNKHGTLLLTGGELVCIWRLHPTTHELRLVHKFNKRGEVSLLEFSNSGNRFFMGFTTGPISIVELSGVDEKPTAAQPEPVSVARKLRLSSDFCSQIGMWSVDDRYVVAAASDNSVNVWDSATGKLAYTLKHHASEVYVVDCHPSGHIFMSGSYDGQVVLWAIETGEMLRKWTLGLDGINFQVLDGCFTKEGSALCVADSFAHVNLFGIGDKAKYKTTPVQQFFASDYSELVFTEDGTPVDAATGVTAHMLQNTNLCDYHLKPYKQETLGVKRDKDAEEMVTSRLMMSSLEQPGEGAPEAANEAPVADADVIVDAEEEPSADEEYQEQEDWNPDAEGSGARNRHERASSSSDEYFADASAGAAAEGAGAVAASVVAGTAALAPTTLGGDTIAQRLRSSSRRRGGAATQGLRCDVM